jgi:hypothetical protein
MRDAGALLSKHLGVIQAAHGGPLGRFTEQNAALVRGQVKVVQEYVDQRLLGLTHDRARAAISASVDDTVLLMSTLEGHFQGISRPLNLGQAIDARAVKDGLARSLLSRHATSVQRYSTAIVGKFEAVLRAGMVTGMSNHRVISMLTAKGQANRITAKRLANKEPAWFPAPTGYMAERYWAERIVRTETAFAYNRAAQETIEGLSGEFRDLKRKILATFDNRTAPDSIAVHGQIRGINDPFTDGAGRVYLHPPGRPNDRETVIPWRPAWPELPSTRRTPPAEVALATERASSNQSALTTEQAAARRKRVAATVSAEIQAAQAARKTQAEIARHGAMTAARAMGARAAKTDWRSRK